MPILEQGTLRCTVRFLSVCPSMFQLLRVSSCFSLSWPAFFPVQGHLQTEVVFALVVAFQHQVETTLNLVSRTMYYRSICSFICYFVSHSFLAKLWCSVLLRYIFTCWAFIFSLAGIVSFQTFRNGQCNYCIVDFLPRHFPLSYMTMLTLFALHYGAISHTPPFCSLCGSCELVF